MSEITGEKQREMLVPCSIYTSWGGRANIVKFLRSGADKQDAKIAQLQSRITTLEKALEVSRACNAFYGDYENWNDDTSFAVDSDFDHYEIDCDGSTEELGGKLARKTEKQIEEILKQVRENESVFKYNNKGLNLEALSRS